MSTADTLYQQLKNAETPAERRDAALILLDSTTQRQYIESAISALKDVIDTLTEDHRPIFRNKALYHFAQSQEKDRAGMIREAMLRFLVHIGHPDDEDLYLRGVLAYHRIPVVDRAQNLRAAALAGLATTNPTLAQFYATRLLGEPDTSEFNSEPSLTAIDVLAQFNNRHPIYLFILLKGVTFAQSPSSEVTAHAFEMLGDDFPIELFEEVAIQYIDDDISTAAPGIIDYVLQRGDDALFPLIERVLTKTADSDLHRYAAIMLAASRQDNLIEILYRHARLSPRNRLTNFIAAVELTQHPERDDLLNLLQARR